MYDTFWYCTCLSIHLLITRIVCIEAEVGEGRLAELCEVLVHLDVAEVGVHGRELILKVFCVQRISTLRNEGRIYLSCRQSLPVNGIKERMTLDILSHQPLIGRLDQQFGYEILKLLMYINIIRYHRCNLSVWWYVPLEPQVSSSNLLVQVLHVIGVKGMKADDHFIGDDS